MVKEAVILNQANPRRCPNCGGYDFVEIAPDKQQCAYCGTVLTLAKAEAPEPKKPDLVICPRCGFGNPPGARYCNNCGKLLRFDLAVTSIAVTVIGFFVFPLLGGILGLLLAYKARRQARAGLGDEKLARIAIIIGWVSVALGIVSLAFFPLCLGAQVGLSLCDELIQALSGMPIGQ